VAFEVLLGRFLLRLTWQELPAAYDIAKGGLDASGLADSAVRPDDCIEVA
jgi:hypothetical protein